MREIKFRVWYSPMGRTEHGIMITHADDESRRYKIGLNGQLYENYGSEHPKTFWESVYDSDWELMQYTGLKDKNGKEIYEGDIIVNNRKWGFANDRGERWIVQFNVETGSYGLLFNGEVLRDPHQNVATLTRKKSGECEVIGNIYENPELLNA